ncbi:ImmA/IrrE family metallo-endopeptidase [Mesorhizobium sp. M1322]|uniref:ImmA/IrrE family metallo-endopeptidase n=1 Tax=Mesorhizobium sp. M1322 TaxID=2957081 RepID=UPI00333D9752
MLDDHIVAALRNEEIDEVAYAWRETLGIEPFARVVEVVHLIENVLPQLQPNFSLVVEKSSNLDNVEAYTEFQPPKIVVRQNVYLAALKYDGRARWTFAHEFGHLVLHDTAVPLHRAPEKYRNMDSIPAYVSAEKQADKFAAALLMPAWIVDEFKTAEELSFACKVSLKAAQIQMSRHGDRRTKELPEAVRRYLKRS